MIKVNEGQRHAFSSQPGEMHLTSTSSYLTLVELQRIRYSLESAGKLHRNDEVFNKNGTLVSGVYEHQVCSQPKHFHHHGPDL